LRARNVRVWIPANPQSDHEAIFRPKITLFQMLMPMRPPWRSSPR
jgi:hypothetical protein